MPGYLVLEALREAAGGHVGPAGVGRDREPTWNGQPERRHLGEPDALAAEQLTSSGGLFVEVVHEARPAHRMSLSTTAGLTNK